jgi:hypothetical protein
MINPKVIYIYLPFREKVYINYQKVCLICRFINGRYGAQYPNVFMQFKITCLFREVEVFL